MGAWWSYALTFIGLAGFWLAGRKVWWCWYVNIANQALWATYATVTRQWGFLIGVAFYLWVFVGNAIRWTREHRALTATPAAQPALGTTGDEGEGE